MGKNIVPSSALSSCSRRGPYSARKFYARKYSTLTMESIFSLLVSFAAVIRVVTQRVTTLITAAKETISLSTCICFYYYQFLVLGTYERSSRNNHELPLVFVLHYIREPCKASKTITRRNVSFVQLSRQFHYV